MTLALRGGDTPRRPLLVAFAQPSVGSQETWSPQGAESELFL